MLTMLFISIGIQWTEDHFKEFIKPIAPSWSLHHHHIHCTSLPKSPRSYAVSLDMSWDIIIIYLVAETFLLDVLMVCYPYVTKWYRTAERQMEKGPGRLSTLVALCFSRSVCNGPPKSEGWGNNLVGIGFYTCTFDYYSLGNDLCQFVALVAQLLQYWYQKCEGPEFFHSGW
jgi:hypothetical protein